MGTTRGRAWETSGGEVSFDIEPAPRAIECGPVMVRAIEVDPARGLVIYRPAGVGGWRVRAGVGGGGRVAVSGGAGDVLGRAVREGLAGAAVRLAARRTQFSGLVVAGHSR
ncbi:hypothetical protein FRAHR75_130055 [Frankia sp. Hr75.2]|nr:hypothetical protein FRAHR75_130055 [Frankia sp. Hr75.2]